MSHNQDPRLEIDRPTGSDAVVVPADVKRQAGAGADVTTFPALASLRLDDADWSRLRLQGFVATEPRANSTIFKLRFRRDGGRQIVRSLGADPQRAAAIEAELTELQARRNLKRELAAIQKIDRAHFRQAKRDIEPFVLANNLRFHGRTVRLPRQCKKH